MSREIDLLNLTLWVGIASIAFHFFAWLGVGIVCIIAWGISTWALED